MPTSTLLRQRLPVLLGLLILTCYAVPMTSGQGMNKREFFDYLIRSGQIEMPRYHSFAAKTQGPADVKLSVLNIGNVVARIRNSGTLGYDRDLLCYEFPFNSTITYRWTLAPMIAGKIESVEGGQTVVRKLVSGAARGAARGTSEDEFRPLKGYDSGQTVIEQNIGIAFSDIPASWPSQWPTLDQMIADNGSYAMSSAARDAFLNNPNFDDTFTGTAVVGPKGFPGATNGEVRAPREAYFVITDNDPEEGGEPNPMNVRVDVWALQWDDTLNRNFIIYRLLFTNIGDKTITDVYVGIHDDPDAPEQGSNEWTDDYAYLVPPGLDTDGDGVPDPDADPRSDVDNDGFYTSEDSLLWNTLYLWDGDDKSEGFVSSGVAWVGLKFLETPVDPMTGSPLGVTALDIFQYTAAPQSDVGAYDQMAGILHTNLSDTDPQQGGGTPILQPDHPDGAPDDKFKILNSYGPDITVVASSGPYTLEPGQSLPFAFASVHGSSQADIINNAKLAQILYNSDYKAASPPPIPKVTAVAGDGQITLYWDDTAELGIYPDGTFGDPLTGNNAFEGYAIYRSDDRGQTFGQALYDIEGSLKGFIPLAIYDLNNGIKGESETRPFFNLGRDSGLRHKYIDSNVENGKQYLYAVVAYDHQDGPVFPLETPINLANPDAPGDNTVRVRPMARPAGVVPGEVGRARQVNGTADITEQEVELVDPTALVTATYRITFEYDDANEIRYSVLRDGQVANDISDRPLRDLALYTENEDYAPTFDGLRVIVENVEFGIKSFEQTVGSALDIREVLNLTVFGWGTPVGVTADYEMRFTDKLWTYTDYNNGDIVTAPFEVFNLTTGQKIHAEIRESDVEENETFDVGERVYLVNVPYPDNEADAAAWIGAFPDDYVYRVRLRDPSTWVEGDAITMISNKTLTPADIFEFDALAQGFDQGELEDDLEEITVVPNPYVVSSEYEEGRFSVQRQLQFHQLPEQCTIRIFTSAGELVQRIEHNGGSIEGWNLQTYNGQEVAFGIYLYVIETQDGTQQSGKFAVIK